MWIESYKAGGRKYYRAVEGNQKIHLGSAESIVRRLKPDALAKRTKTLENPPNFSEGEEAEPPESDIRTE